MSYILFDVGTNWGENSLPKAVESNDHLNNEWNVYFKKL